MGIEKPFDFDEDKKRWSCLEGFNEKGRSHEVDLEEYRTLMLRSLFPFQAAFKALSSQLKIVRRDSDVAKMRPVRLFERDWNVIFDRGKNIERFRSVPIIA